MSISPVDGAWSQNWVWILKEGYGKVEISGLFTDKGLTYVRYNGVTDVTRGVSGQKLSGCFE